MRKITAYLISLFLINPSFAAGVPEKHPTDQFSIGKPSSSDNKEFIFDKGLGSSNPKIRYNLTTSQLEFSNNGSSFRAIGSGGGGAGGIAINTGVNGDFEAGATDWTASGGSFTQASAGSNLLFDAKSGVFNASASSQTLSNTLVAIPNGLANNSGVGSCWFKTTATDYKLQIHNGTTVLAENVIPALSDPAQVKVPFTFPSSGSVRLRIISQSNAADLAIDNCFLGESSNREIIQSSAFATITDNASCQYSNSTPGSWQDIPQATGTCGVYTYTGAASASGLSGPQPSFKIADMPAGDYLIQVTGSFNAANNASNQFASFSLYDGVNRYNAQNLQVGTLASGFIGTPTVSFFVSKGASSTNQVFRIQSYVNTQATINVDGSAGTGYTPLVFSIMRFPSSSEQAQRVNEQPSYGILKINEQAISYSVSAAQAYGTANDASWGAATKTYLGSAGACSNANDFCIKLGKLKQGLYDVYVNGTTLLRDSGLTCRFRMFDGTDPIGAFEMSPSGSSEHVANSGFHGYLKVDADTYGKEISLQIGATGSSGLCNFQSGSLTAMEIGVIPTTMSIADLVMKNSVQVQNSTQLNKIDFTIGGATTSTDCGSSPCTVRYSSGGVSSVTRSGTGNYQINVNAGVCGTPLNCVFSGRNFGGSTDVIAFINTPATTTDFTLGTITDAGVAADAYLNAQCSCQKP